MDAKKALIIVDPQNDFADEKQGSLYVKGGENIVLAIDNYVKAHRKDYTRIATTQDWHMAPGNHFSFEPDYVDTWPPHCEALSWGARIHDNLLVPVDAMRFYKGQYAAAYSGFEGKNGAQESLNDYLTVCKIDTVDVCGLALSHCVMATALDAKRFGYDTNVLIDLTTGVDKEQEQIAIEKLMVNGVQIIESSSV